MKPIHYFAGGNTAQGFFSCFENILPTAERKRMFYIKGGPGVGKSTLMRRAGEAAEQAGYAVEYFHCSSDPDSLDGIALPERGLAMMDGTAPHVYDPVIPGARDTLLSLGDFLQEAALRPHVREIAHVQGEISARFERCYHYLAAAKCVLEAARRGRENPQKLMQAANGLCEKLPLRGGHGSVRQLFASAYTPKGLVDLLQALGSERTLTVECPFGQHATGLMREISKLSAARGLQVVELLDPLCPNEIAHVVLPAHGLAFCTGSRKKEKEGEWLEAEKLFDRIEMGEKEQSFDRNAYELLLQRAIEQLASAKALHDELESFYVANMDFIKWNGILEQVLEAIGE